MTDEEPVATRQLDPPRRLSESLLWKLESEYYQRAGLAAWSSDRVPSTMTNSPALARAYVQVIEGLVEDCAAGRMGPFDPSAPIYVVELGAGTGRLGYYVASALQRASLGAVPVVTVLTDVVAQNVAFLADHPKLRPLIGAGRLDVSVYDAAAGGPLRLQHAGTELQPGTLANPLVAIANYLFDVLPQDLYCLTPDGLEEQLVEVLADSEEPGSVGWDLAEHIFLAPRQVPVPDDRYDARARAVLDAVVAQRHAGERFLFPVAAISAIDRIRELAGDRLLLLVAERADADLEPAEVDATTAYHPGLFLRLASYGASFSLPVDLGILEVAARQAGAALLRGTASAHRLALAALVAGDGGGATSVRARYRASVVEMAPDDVVRAATSALAAVGASDERGEAALEILLAALRLTGYDAVTFGQCFDDLAACLPPPPAMLEETLAVLEQVNDLNFWIKPQGDTAYAVATLVAHCGRYERALALLDAARDAFGPRATGWYNAAMCLLALGRPDEAVAALDACLALEPAHDRARQLLQRLR